MKILIPAAFPSILTGLKIGWAFAWRTLIAAELVFGASSGKGGLGWFIYESQEHARHPFRVRRPVHGDPDRPVGRELHFPHHRERHGAQMGHAKLTA